MKKIATSPLVVSAVFSRCVLVFAVAGDGSHAPHFREPASRCSEGTSLVDETSLQTALSYFDSKLPRAAKRLFCGARHDGCDGYHGYDG